MPLRLIVGPPNSGRAGEVRRRLQERALEEPVLVVPTADDTAWFERELCADGEPRLGISIRTFGWLFADVAAAVGAETGALLTGPQRLALIRAAIATTDLRRLRRSSRRPGFAPALDALIEELQGALVTPTQLADRAGDLEDGAHEAELAALYAAYEGLREDSHRSDRGAMAAGAIASLRAHPEAWPARPVFVYGFDDLTLAQRELIRELARSADVTVAVNYADRRSLAARATLVSELLEEGAEIETELGAGTGHSEHASLRHLDSALFEPDPGTVPLDDGVVLLECAGERGEAETIAQEIAHLLAEGVEPEDVAVVVRHPSSAGAVMAGVLAASGIPAALEAHAPVDRTAVGRALIALCRAAGPGGTAQDLLAHMRADSSFDPSFADGVERRIRRGTAESAADVYEGWEHPPRHLARLGGARNGASRLQALAWIARDIAESAHRERAPLAAPSAAGGSDLVHPLELRAAVAAAELLEELATLGDLPGCPEPTLEDAIEALEGASVQTWRGPTDGRVRILSPYRLRAGRARYLFCAALGDGEFPSPAPPDPLLGDDRRRELAIPQLGRREQADEERYLFHSCVSRPTERLYLSWRSCDDEGLSLARSPFVDEVLDLLGDDPAASEEALKRTRGLEEVVPAPADASSERQLARALAIRRPSADHAARLLDAAGVEAGPRERVLASVSSVPDPQALPGPLRVEAVVRALRERRVLSANQLEGWLSCPYRWFVEHELQPMRLEPESDPLWLGGVVHAALEQLYREAPGADAIPRPGDVKRWQERFGELLGEAAGDTRLGPERVAAVARAREQVERFLSDEAESESPLRPREDLLEYGFGMESEDAEGGLALGDFVLRGKIDRIDLAPDGKVALVRDYKTGSRVTPAGRFEQDGSLQIQLYVLVARDILGLDVVGGLYQPLGATGNRRPRGLTRKGDERLDGLSLVRGDPCEEDAFEEKLEAARERAIAAGQELRQGTIGRRPLNGSCPAYCTYQPICRLERALGPAGEDANGEES